MIGRKRIKKVFESCVFLINPNRFPQMAKYTKKVLKSYDASAVNLTESRDHFIEEVKQFYHNSRFKYLLVWGGDGTAHTAINTLMNEKSRFPGEFDKRKALGFMRGGSGNGIQDSYEVPIRILKQIETYGESMKNDYTIRTDLMEVRSNKESHYGQLLGVGMDSKILLEREKRTYRFGERKGEIVSGMPNYFRAIFGTYFSRKTPFCDQYEVHLKKGKYMYFGSRVNSQYIFDSIKRQVTVPQIEVGSRPYYAKMFKICPHVICNDGLLDVYLYHFKNRLSVVLSFPNIFTGKHNRINNVQARREQPIIEHYKVKGIAIKKEDPFYFHMDGEIFQAHKQKNGYKIKVKVHPRAIRFLVPPRFYRKFHPFEE